MGCHGRKDEDENQFQGFPRAARKEGRTQRVADDREALLQVEKAVSTNSWKNTSRS